ncbi:hypothetical protein K3495_g7936 [Podosphaera aphanis]|nr:hypothetical protein K3495_g7936 [Podosphaera aphanis]
MRRYPALPNFCHLKRSTQRGSFPIFNDENAEVFSLALSATVPPSLSFDSTPQRLDAVTSSGIAALSAILLAANPLRPACVPSKDYWNDECSDQRRRYLEARHSGDPDLISEAHNSFRKSVRRAKREYKRSKLDNVSSILEAHKVIAWRKLSSRFAPPPQFNFKVSRIAPQPSVQTYSFELSLPAQLVNQIYPRILPPARCVRSPHLSL